jgi:hypothetical protein
MSFDEMKYEDFSWIRWERMRWDFANVIAKLGAIENYNQPTRLMSTQYVECVDVLEMLPKFGTELLRYPDYGDLYVGFAKIFEPLVTAAMRDGMMVLSPYIAQGTGHPLRGYSEVPFEVGRIIHSSYFTNVNRDDKFTPHVSDDPADEIRELLYAFVKLAFPDDFMAAVHRKNSDIS